MIDDIDQKLTRLHLRCRRNVDQLLAGHYRSVFKGRGLEFDEVRPYQIGDDTRSIDWNVTARCGSPFIKRYQEERELCMLFIVDLSASAHYGTATATKRDTVVEFCAQLALTAQRNHDRAGLVICSERVETYLPPVPGQSAVMRLLRELLEFQPTNTGTNLRAAFEFVATLRLRRSTVFVVSDFQAEGWAEELGILAMRHDVIAVSVADAREDELPAAGLVQLRDVETGEVASVDLHSAKTRAAFIAQRSEQQNALDRTLREAGADHLKLRTDRDCIEDILAFFHAREHRTAEGLGH